MEEYCRVLIVDDELIMRQGMKHMLEWEKEGFQIVGEASNGQEGLSLVEELKPHIILADIVMPIIDGIEFSEIIGRRFPDIQLIILSSYDKFEYVKTTLMNGASDYILKPTLNSQILLNTLKKAVERIPGLQLSVQTEVPYASQMEKVLLGFKDKLDMITFAGFFPHTLFRVLAINIREAAGRNKEDMISMKRLAEEHYAEKTVYASLPVFLNEGSLCVVINYRLKDETAVIIDAQELSERLSRIFPKVFLVLSKSFSNMQEIRTHYQQEVSQELSHAFYYPRRHLLVAEEFCDKGSLQRFEFETFTRLLSQQRYEEALLQFQEYTQYLCDMMVEEEKLKNLTRNLLYNFLIEIEKYNIDSDRLKDQYFDWLDEAQWIDQFQAAIQEITSELTAMLETSDCLEDQRIQMIKQYAAQHYQEPLELSDIAEKFGLSYHYISSYFSQMTNEGFSEYLNRLRIEHALSLLKTTDLSIAEVGGNVGYADHSYFCRVFKKITGDTPSGYRRREGQKER